MPGISRTVANGKTIEYEFVLIRMEASGDIVYVAKPSGQAEVTFKLVSVSKTEVVFENLNHDFPQRIRYALQTDGSLIAAIEGIQGGKLRRVTFPYHRTKH